MTILTFFKTFSTRKQVNKNSPLLGEPIDKVNDKVS